MGRVCADPLVREHLTWDLGIGLNLMEPPLEPLTWCLSHQLMLKMGLLVTSPPASKQLCGCPSLPSTHGLKAVVSLTHG